MPVGVGDGGPWVDQWRPGPLRGLVEGGREGGGWGVPSQAVLWFSHVCETTCLICRQATTALDNPSLVKHGHCMALHSPVPTAQLT